MAYSLRDLSTEWMPQVRIPNGSDITLDDVSNAIQNQADENGIPLAFSASKLKTGGLFSSDTEDILIMYNPQHAGDYLRFAIRVTHQGKYAFMHIFNLGGSANYGHENGAAEEGLFGTVAKISNAIGGHKRKLQEEEDYYAILRDCIEDIFIK